ncbi:hypothetical protein MTBLM1_60118 [Rhodospirillaceae bacterium LM-1]|nr:hypothetical protein MTBLM1_60118 [Rhodospirillaceae bacterium LM-1]
MRINGWEGMIRFRRILTVPVIISLAAALLFIGQQIYEIVVDAAVDAEFCASPLNSGGILLSIPWGTSGTCRLDLVVVCLWFGMAFAMTLLAAIPAWLIALRLWTLKLK